ncbi:MAG TPA: hypothetical protein VFT43_05895 [Candidatus Polarisedimenticolia bacterium]|nr:hypothetical protein [Candidatus Polarisedimenticolia bacterium]
MESDTASAGLPDAGPPDRPVRFPAIARACFHLDWIFALFWAIYLLGPDALGLWGPERGGILYATFTASFFLLHFVLMSTGIIALFVVIIEIYAERPVRGFAGVLVALALPIVSFLWFAGRYLLEVDRWLRG